MNNYKTLRDFAFRCLYGFRGVPKHFGSRIIRLDESLRRWSPDVERDIREAMDKYLRPGDVVFDIGANFGLHTLHAALSVAPDGMVYAFEPEPRNIRLLEKNISLNNLTHSVTVVRSAVSNSAEKTLEFFVPKESVSVTAGLRPVGELNKKIAVPNVRLDDFSFRNKQALRLIKIDVEGAEAEVLKGAESLLRSLHPILLIEVHGFALPSFGSSVNDLLGFLEACGYQEKRLSSDFTNGDEYYQAVFTPAIFTLQ